MKVICELGVGQVNASCYRFAVMVPCSQACRVRELANMAFQRFRKLSTLQEFFGRWGAVSTESQFTFRLCSEQGVIFDMDDLVHHVIEDGQHVCLTLAGNDNRQSPITNNDFSGGRIPAATPFPYDKREYQGTITTKKPDFPNLLLYGELMFVSVSSLPSGCYLFPVGTTEYCGGLLIKAHESVDLYPFTAGDIIVQVNGEDIRTYTFDRAHRLLSHALCSRRQRSIAHDIPTASSTTTSGIEDDYDVKKDNSLLTRIGFTKKTDTDECNMSISLKKDANGFGFLITTLTDQNMDAASEHEQLRLQDQVHDNVPMSSDNPETGMDDGGPTDDDVYVKEVLRGGPAHRDGRLQCGDQLVVLNSNPVRSLHEVVRYLQSLRIGDEIVLNIKRKKQAHCSTEDHNQDQQQQQQQQRRRQRSITEAMRSQVTLTTFGEDISVTPTCHQAVPNRYIFRIRLNQTKSAGLGISVKGRRTASVQWRRFNGSSSAVHEDSRVSCTDDAVDGGIFVNSVLHGGAADKDGRLKPGDRLLTVNGVCLETAQSNQHAMDLLRQSMINIQQTGQQQQQHYCYATVEVGRCMVGCSGTTKDNVPLTSNTDQCMDSDSGDGSAPTEDQWKYDRLDFQDSEYMEGNFPTAIRTAATSDSGVSDGSMKMDPSSRLDSSNNIFNNNNPHQFHHDQSCHYGHVVVNGDVDYENCFDNSMYLIRKRQSDQQQQQQQPQSPGHSSLVVVNDVNPSLCKYRSKFLSDRLRRSNDSGNETDSKDSKPWLRHKSQSFFNLFRVSFAKSKHGAESSDMSDFLKLRAKEEKVCGKCGWGITDSTESVSGGHARQRRSHKHPLYNISENAVIRSRMKMQNRQCLEAYDTIVKQPRIHSDDCPVLRQCPYCRLDAESTKSLRKFPKHQQQQMPASTVSCPWIYKRPSASNTTKTTSTTTRIRPLTKAKIIPRLIPGNSAVYAYHPVTFSFSDND